MVTLSTLIEKEYINSNYETFTTPFRIFISKILPTLQKSGDKIYPQPKNIFRALNLVAPKDTKVIILSQDPYHDGSALGVAFDNLKSDRKISPSLYNVLKEMKEDVGLSENNYESYLGHLPSQGVLLLNTALTVVDGKPTSHSELWKEFTEELIKEYNKYDNIIWVLWGNHAKSFKHLITNTTHHFIESAHPSPLSASRGFFGSKPFSKINSILKSIKKEEIKW